MKDKSNMYKAGLRKKIYLIVFLMLAVGGAVVCAAVAAERSGMYWIGLGGEVSAENPEDNKGFFTVDVSDFLNTAGTGGGEAADEGSELVPLAIGPLPSIPTLTDEELKLYGILSKNDGRISEEDKTALDKDIQNSIYPKKTCARPTGCGRARSPTRPRCSTCRTATTT